MQVSVKASCGQSRHKFVTKLHYSRWITNSCLLKPKTIGFLLPGTPGEEVCTFKALKKGETTISMEYSRPWEGSEKTTWTFVLTVVVKWSTTETTEHREFNIYSNLLHKEVL